MNCSCLIDSYYDEVPEFYKREEPVARKEHKCMECGDIIHPGEQYVKHVGKWDDDFVTHIECSSCAAIASQFYCSRAFGYLWEDIQELIVEESPLPWAEIGELPTKARNKLLDFIEKVWEEIDDE